MKRENFGSRLGILAAAAGSAIGLGNIWKFPYVTGRNGGAAFILVYLLCIAIVGVPILMSEFAIGRSNNTNAVDSFKKIAPKSKWHWTGYLAVSTSFIILSFYAIIAGWVFSYILKALTGGLKLNDGESFGDIFTSLIANPIEPTLATLLVLVVTGVIVFFGVKDGIEKFSKISMPILIGLIILLIIRSVTLPGAEEGLEFLFKPDFSKLTVHGVLEALGHSFYTLSLGMGIILTYGSYISKKENIVTLSYQVAVADTIIALMAGIVIFPAVFAYGLEPTAGPGLLFITIPAVFSAMPFGQVFEILFFVLIGIAAITSTVSLMETVVSFVGDQFKLERKKAIICIVLGLFLLSIPSILSFGPLENVKIINEFGIFDTLDYITNSIFLPVGGILICLFVAWVWGIKNAEEEITNKGEFKFSTRKIYEISIKILAPGCILIIFLYGLGVFDIIKNLF